VDPIKILHALSRDLGSSNCGTWKTVPKIERI